jgi:hypothetical protein
MRVRWSLWPRAGLITLSWEIFSFNLKHDQPISRSSGEPLLEHVSV